MRGRTILVLLIIAVGLAAFIAFFERQTLTTEERYEQRRKAFIVDPDRVSYLAISNEELQVQCRKQDDQWKLVSPVKARADQGEISRLLYDLEATELRARISAKERKARGLTLADYGLDQPRAQVTFTEGDRTVTILIGKEAPLGDNVYAMVAGRDDILAISPALASGLPRKVDQLRDHDLFYFKRHEIAELALRRPEGYVRLKNVGSDHWRLTQPVEARADRDAVGKILDQLYATRIVDFVADEVQDATLYGLADSSYAIEVYLTARPEPEVLLLGKMLEKEPHRMYAMWKSERSVCVVTTNLLEQITTPLAKLRDWRLIPIRDFEVAEIDLEAGENKLRLEKEDVDWKLAEPVSVDADQPAVRDLLRTWTSARVSDFISSPDTNAARYGLDRPRAVVRFVPEKHAFSWTNEVKLIWGDSVPGKKGQRYVTCDGEKEIWVVGEDVLDQTSFDWLHYRTRQMLDVASFSVRKLILIAGGQTQVVARADSGEEFRSETAGREALPADELKSLVENLAQLRAQSLVGCEPADLARYGLDKPRMKLVIEVTPESGVGKTVLIGNETPEEGAYAMVAGTEIVFTLSPDLYQQLKQGLTREPVGDKERKDILGSEQSSD